MPRMPFGRAAASPPAPTDGCPPSIPPVEIGGAMFDKNGAGGNVGIPSCKAEMSPEGGRPAGAARFSFDEGSEFKAPRGSTDIGCGDEASGNHGGADVERGAKSNGEDGRSENLRRSASDGIVAPFRGWWWAKRDLAAKTKRAACAALFEFRSARWRPASAGSHNTETPGLPFGPGRNSTWLHLCRVRRFWNLGKDCFRHQADHGPWVGNRCEGSTV